MSTEEGTLPEVKVDEKETITLTKEELSNIVKNLHEEVKRDILKETEIKTAQTQIREALNTVRSIDPIHKNPEVNLRDLVENVIEEYEAGVKMNGVHRYCIRQGGVDFPYKGDELKFKIITMKLEGQSVDEIVKCYEQKYGRS